MLSILGFRIILHSFIDLICRIRRETNESTMNFSSLKDFLLNKAGQTVSHCHFCQRAVKTGQSRANETSHFEGSIALSAVQTAQRRDEPTQRELATFGKDLGGAWLVSPVDCA